MMQLIIPARSQPLRHRLNTLPLARSDQTRNVQRTHPLSRLMAQTAQEGFKPALEIVVPIQNLVRHDRLSNSRSAIITKPPIRESPYRRSAKVVLGNQQ